MQQRVESGRQLVLDGGAVVAFTPAQFEARIATGRIVRSAAPALPDGKIVCRLNTECAFKSGEIVSVLDPGEARVHFK